MRSSWLGLVIVLCVALLSRGAFAQPQKPPPPPAPTDVPTNAALAQTLFAEGRALVIQERWGDACAKFEESQRILPASGTLLNLGLCHEKIGKLTLAYAELGESVSRALMENRPEREALAREHLAAIEARVARITVNVAEDVAKIEGLEVKLDGAILRKPAWGVRTPVDPGPHVVEATAPKREPFRSTIDIGAEGESKIVDLPVLTLSGASGEEDHLNPTPPPVTKYETKKPKTKHLDPRVRNRLVLGGLIGGLGVSALHISLGLALEAKSAWDDAKKHCPNLTCRTAEEQERGRDAATEADIATGFLIVGSGAVIAGAVLLVTARSAARSKPSPSGAAIAPILGSHVAGIAYGSQF